MSAPPATVEIERPLPSDSEAERYVLGAVLLDGASLPAIRREVGEYDFFFPAYRKIYARICKLADANLPIEEFALSTEFQGDSDVESAGGSAFIARLADGMPRINHATTYAKNIREKAILRSVAYDCEAIKNQALEKGAAVEEVLARLKAVSATSATCFKPALRAVSADELLTITLPPREFLLEPLISRQSLSLLYGKRGNGKTYAALGVCVAVASGGRFLKWNAPKPRKVLYVDGELPAAVLRERVASVLAGADKTPESPDFLRFLTPDLQDRPFPDLSTREGQSLIEAHLDGVELAVFDNLSALCRTGKENEGESWLPVQEWSLRLRQRGISVLFVHHAGKGGTQRGTSRREDLLDTVIALRHSNDYNPAEGLRVELHFEKCRSFHGADAEPFEVKMETDSSGAAVWTTRSLENVTASKAAELFEAGMSVRDVAEELHISKSKAHRLKKCPSVPASRGWDSGTAGREGGTVSGT